MPLTSNKSVRKSLKCKLDDSGNVIYDAMNDSYRVSFTVSPSPCLNLGNHKDPTPYSFKKVEEWPANGQQVEWYKSIYWNGSAWVPGIRYYRGFGPEPNQRWYDYSLTIPREDSYNRCLSKLWDKVRQSEVSLNTTIGEGRETLAMLSSVQGSALRLLRDLRSPRRLLRSLRSLGRELADNPLQSIGSVWLGWSVGWKPLLSDLENLSNHILSAKAESVVFEATARSGWQYDDAIIDGISNYYRYGDRGKHETLQYSIRHHMSMKYRIKDLNQYEVWRAGLTVRPTLAWELTRLSFVVDYFYNVGQLLELLEASCFNNGIEFVSGYYTRTSKEERTFALNWVTDRPVDKNGDITAFSANYRARMVTIAKSRSLLTAFPTPVLPVVKIPKASTPLLNIAALLSNLISRKS